MKWYVLVVIIVLAVSGCSLRNAPVKPVSSSPESHTESATEVPMPPETLPAVPLPPKFAQPDWQASFEPLVAEMLGTQDITAESALLPGNVNNRTNGSLQMAQATSVLYDVLSVSEKLTLVSSTQLSQARQALGLSENDSLGLRSKLIGLARYLGASYVLYTDVSGEVKSPGIKMQLLSVQTGEIIWSGNGFVKYTSVE